MATCAEVTARTLADAGITRMFGLPGGEVLELIEAARLAGIDFVLAHDENMAAFMADATGQITRRPGVCLSTLGPGALNMVLGVANAFLDRSPMLAITGAIASTASPYATHQNVDLAAIYRQFTKATVVLDGRDTAGKVRRALRIALEMRPGPVHVLLPGDVARGQDVVTAADPASDDIGSCVPAPSPPSDEALAQLAGMLREARRPVIVLGLDLAPYRDTALVRQFVECLGVPVFVAPKAKGVLSEDHPLFFGVCAGVAADHVVLDFLAGSDLLLGVGYDPVESNRIWHHTMPLVSIGPLSIASGRFRPRLEVVGDVARTLRTMMGRGPWRFEWPREAWAAYREALGAALSAPTPGGKGLSPYDVVRRLRTRLPRDTIATTDVGSVKFVVSQAWTAWEPGMLLQSNGLSAMGFAFPGAMAARLAMPDRPVLCTVGDGGFSMCLGEIETCVRRNLAFLTVVFNDRQLSLIHVLQRNRGLATHGVGYGAVDFAAIARACGAWGRTVTTADELDEALSEALRQDRLTVLDVAIDSAEYARHTAPG